jgi:hypothetical protein
LLLKVKCIPLLHTPPHPPHLVHRPLDLSLRHHRQLSLLAAVLEHHDAALVRLGLVAPDEGGAENEVGGWVGVAERDTGDRDAPL